jgi:16S rRNA (uracil1498-N3)-methyltransferase
VSDGFFGRRLHRFFVEPDQLSGESVSFSEGQSHQLRKVLRLAAGDTVLVFDGVSRHDRIVKLVDHRQGRIVGERGQAAEPRTRLVVYPALLQRDKFEPVLQKLTELGVAAIAPVLTVRGLVREPPDDHRQSRWRSILREAAEQCGRGVVPALLLAVPFSQAIASAEGTLVMAYEGERRRTLSDALADVQSRVSLFVGPEGGYDPTEAEQAAQAGARLVTLGPRILRTETASPVLAALVLYVLGDLSSGRDDDNERS